MSETSGQDEPRNEPTNDREIMVGWVTKPTLLGWATSPVTRRKTDAERAMANMFRLAEEAESFEDCINSFEKAVKLCREYGLQLAPPPPPPQGRGGGHQERMDASRIVITVILILGVLAIVGWSLSLQNASAAAQYVAPVSGLAGICLGWLFTNQPNLPSRRERERQDD
jgi:hypothetical protein